MRNLTRTIATLLAAVALASLAAPAHADGGGTVTPNNHWCC
jgi:hypothetical protein